eukprot:6610155-Pyramimonas_sp.AAC.1
MDASAACNCISVWTSEMGRTWIMFWVIGFLAVLHHSTNVSMLHSRTSLSQTLAGNAHPHRLFHLPLVILPTPSSKPLPPFPPPSTSSSL